MAAKTSIWKRIARWFRPERETYESRRGRPGEAVDRPGGQFDESTDQRRAAWTAW